MLGLKLIYTYVHIIYIVTCVIIYIAVFPKLCYKIG